MKFDRDLLNDYIVSLLNSSKQESRCVGHNFLIEENVSEERRFELEAHDPSETNARKLLNSYFKKYVQGEKSGHISSTFMMPINYPALESVVVDLGQKLYRLENIDDFLKPRENGIDFVELEKALKDGGTKKLYSLIRKIQNFPGERPMFAAFEDDIRPIIRKPDWLPCVIDLFGLFHHYQNDPEKPKHFAFMEYTAAEVVEQAHAKGIEYCFALPIVLESQGNPAFCPVPRSSTCGRVVNLGGPFPAAPIGEILHVRIDYQPRHFKFLGVWTGGLIPDIEPLRERHLVRVREETGRAEFGKGRKVR